MLTQFNTFNAMQRRQYQLFVTFLKECNTENLRYVTKSKINQL